MGYEYYNGIKDPEIVKHFRKLTISHGGIGFNSETNYIVARLNFGDIQTLGDILEAVQDAIKVLGEDATFFADGNEDDGYWVYVSKNIPATDEEIIGMQKVKAAKQALKDKYEKQRLDQAKNLLRQHGYEVDD